MKSPDLSHHRAYRSVHGGSLVFINLQVIAGHGHIALTGYFFVKTEFSISAALHAPLRQFAISCTFHSGWPFPQRLDT